MYTIEILLFSMLAGLTAAWQLNNDLFIDFTSLSDLNKFTQETRDSAGASVNERQTYSSLNARITNGLLNIYTHRTWDGRYLSAKLRSKFTIRYGVVEMKAKLPWGRGTWPAFGLLPAKAGSNWPQDGEIDIMEHIGFKQDRIHCAVHTQNNYGERSIASSTLVPGVSSGFHVYKLDWSPNRIIISVDNQPFFTYTKSINADYNSWPFDNYFNLIFNTAVSGLQGIEDSIFPQAFAIDYIRYSTYKGGYRGVDLKWLSDARANSKWALGCDWIGNDLVSVHVRGEHCATRCKVNPLCTHFAWTDRNGGTCWLKSGWNYQRGLLTNVPSSYFCGYLL